MFLEAIYRTRDVHAFCKLDFENVMPGQVLEIDLGVQW